MRKSLAIIPLLFIFTLNACTPTQVQTAKDVLGKISFYANMAKTLVAVAETYYADNVKVKAALEATKASLATVESLSAAVSAGIEKDEAKLIAATAVLISNVFVLMNAIKEAKKGAPATAPPTK